MVQRLRIHLPMQGTQVRSYKTQGSWRSLRTTTKNSHSQNLINKIIQPLSKCLFKKGVLLPLLQACPHIQTPPHPFRNLHPDHPLGVGDATACRSAERPGEALDLLRHLCALGNPSPDHGQRAPPQSLGGKVPDPRGRHLQTKTRPSPAGRLSPPKST